MPLELSDILDPSYLQAILETFCDDMRSKGIQVASAIMNEEARPIIYEVNHCSFCKKVRETKAGQQDCRKSDRAGIKRAERHFNETGKIEAIFYICEMGLLDFCAPITINGTIIGYFFGGQLKGNYKNLISPNTPNLEGLLRTLEPNEKDGKEANKYVEALIKEFTDMRTTDKDKFILLKQAVDAIAQQLNSIVGKLYEAKHIEVIEKFMQKAIEAGNVDELFNLIVTNLPLIMDARYCSIFTVQKGETKEDDCLVLRKTSHPTLKIQEDSAYYKRGDKALTCWVWENAKSLRLKDVTNSIEIEQYNNLAWSGGRYPDSDEHKGFLAVPIIDRKNQVIGVVRMPHKIIKPEVKTEIGFTKHDQIFLNFFAHHLSRVIECQELVDQFEHAIGSKGLINAVQELSRAPSYKEVLGLIAQHSMSLFGGGEGKKYFLNRYSPNSQTWTVKKTGGDLALIGEWENRKFSITEGLTGKVIREKQPILLYNLEKAIDDDCYLEAASDGKSAMAAPLQHGEKIYGIIGVVSNKKFSFSEKDLQILTILAEISAEAIIRTRWFRLREILKKIWELLAVKLWGSLFIVYS